MERDQVNRQGFSLLEVLVVLAILGILLSIGFVSYISWMRSLKAEASVADLTRIMGVAVSLSRNKNQDMLVKVSNRTVSVYQGTSLQRSIDLDITDPAVNLTCRQACTNGIEIKAPFGTIKTDSKFSFNYVNKSRTVYFLGPEGVLKVTRS